MADYKTMYQILCKAADEAIDPLDSIPLAEGVAYLLRRALLEAEEVYINTADGESGAG